MLVPPKDDFLRATQGGKRMPVYRDILADLETPLSVYWKLAHDELYSFLLESVTGGEQLARYSVIGTKPRVVLRSKGRQIRRIGPARTERWAIRETDDPLTLLKSELFGGDGGLVEVPGLPKFVGGAVGMLGYDYVRFLERLPGTPCDDLGMDDMAMMVPASVVVFDHAKNLIRIIVAAEGTAEAYDAARGEIERIVGRLKAPLPELPHGSRQRANARPANEARDVDAPSFPLPASNQSREQFEAAAARIIEYISAGDCIQAVYSQRFVTPTSAHPVAVYRALRSLNPSPYMFLLRFGDFDLVGASPEILVSLQGRTARVRPIAGTRPRGSTPEEDACLERELLSDEKERAEHIMLVDLGRNDLGRVCEYGSVTVRELMVVERYSHVMHIVSDVTGTLAEGKDAFDLIRASFPAGTVSGAPKVRAMEIIDELEPTRRGPYAGSVGYVSYTGDMDMAITIRTILITKAADSAASDGPRPATAYVQSGAGIVYDSVPEREYEETVAKAKAALRALEIAERGEV